jgi:hypothetical protein
VQTCAADANGCLALSAPAVCPADQVCAGRQSRCTTCPRPIGTSAAPTAQVQHIGTRTVGDVVPFTVPANSAGFSIVSQAVNAQKNDVTIFSGGQGFLVANSVVPELVKDPNGATFYNDNAKPPADLSTALAAYGGLSPSTGTFTAPNTTAALNAFAGGVTAGNWTFTVGDLALECVQAGPTVCTGGSTTSTYDITVITQPAKAIGATSTVHIGIYLVTNSLTAATAAGDPGMLRMVSTLGTLYGRAGLTVAQPTFYDVPASAKALYATGVAADHTGPCDELDQMFTLSVAGKNELSFFFVDDILQSANGGVGSVVGIDGTVPGPSSIGGTVHSGAVVNASNLGTGTCGATLDFLGCGSDLVAYIAAHEGGHWMGLYHTTEAFGNLFDPVADTAQCPCTSCAPAASQAKCIQNNPALPPGQVPTEMTGPNCNKGGSCDGSQFLMFWLIDNTSIGNFSAQQAQIVRANPVVQ